MSEIVYAPTPCLCVESVDAGKDYTLRMTFSDGKKKVFDFRPMLTKKIYQALSNISLFLQAETDGCGVVWNDDIDIDPTYLYEHGVEIE